MPFHCLLTSFLTVNLIYFCIVVSLYTITFLLLFSPFSLCFGFLGMCVGMMCSGIDSLCLWFEVCWAFHEIWNVFGYYFFKYLQCPLLLELSLHVSLLDILPQVFEAHSFFFFILFLFFPLFIRLANFHWTVYPLGWLILILPSVLQIHCWAYPVNKNFSFWLFFLFYFSRISTCFVVV